MAVIIRWRDRGTGSVLLLLSFLCWVSFSHGRNIVPGDLDLSSLPSTTAKVREFQLEGVELDSEFDGIMVSAYTARMRGDVKCGRECQGGTGFRVQGYGIQLKIQFSASEAQNSSPITGEISRRTDDTDSDRRSENHFVSVIQGRKWKRTLEKIAEWILHACVVVLAVYAIFYTISCVFACCIGLDLLAEIWRILGGWQAFNYFVHVEQAVVETDPEPLPLLRSAAEP